MNPADIAIIGTGPGGVSAAITAKVRGKHILLFGSQRLSEKLHKASTILNYPGVPSVSGSALADAMAAQLKELEIPILPHQVTAVYAMPGYFAIQTPDTMYEANGVGLAAPQVGILKRLVVIDIGDGQGPFIMINPEIVESSGEQTGDEGCLSLPGKAGTVTRPNYVKAKYYDLDMNECEVVGEELLARAICHELDHLDGHMYVELVEDGLHDVTYEESEE